MECSDHHLHVEVLKQNLKKTDQWEPLNAEKKFIKFDIMDCKPNARICYSPKI